MTLLGVDLLRFTIFLLSYIKQDLPNHLEEGAHEIRKLSTPVIDTTNEILPSGCELPNERFYAPDEQCYKLMTQGPCPRNQLFFIDDSNDEGICDCISNEYLYSTETNHCYKRNSQGPCEEGDWFTLSEEALFPSPIPSCEPVPEGCLADGRHVYWSLDEGSGDGNGKQCFKLGTQGPCSNDEIVVRLETTGHVDCRQKSLGNKVSKVNRLLNAAANEEIDPRAVGYNAPYLRSGGCSSGSRRSQNGICKKSW